MKQPFQVRRSGTPLRVTVRDAGHNRQAIIEMLEPRRLLSVALAPGVAAEQSATPGMELSATDAPLGLRDSLVVGPHCSPELLAAKTQGILRAMADLVDFIGYDISPTLAPVTFHLEADAEHPYTPDVTTAYWYVDDHGKGQIYTFDLDATNRLPPFTPENAVKPESQALPIHEAMHGWFETRIANYAIEEPFCKLISMYLTNIGDETWFAPTFSYPDRLMYDLAQLGMNRAKLALILNHTGQKGAEKGSPLTRREFCDICSDVLGQDATGAFARAASPLNLNGTDAANTISITAANGQYTIVQDGATSYTWAGDVSAINIQTFGGDDRITIGAGVMGVSVKGGAGNDTIIGGDGNDTLYGDDGDDSIAGNGGDDSLVGNWGNDTMDGGDGADQLQGGLGYDSLMGGIGNDSIYGGDQSDTISGDEGDDYIEARGKADTVHSGAGNDTIWGGAGNDLLYGDEGDDWIDVGYCLFSDTVNGGAGQDTLQCAANDLNDVLEDTPESMLYRPAGS